MDKYLISKEDGKPRVFEVSSVSNFVELATWLYTSEAVIFRGQAKEAGWPLIPAVGRFLEGSRIPWGEKEILAEFKREAVPYLTVLPSNDWQWLATAQHNRLPTRLLDWTRNPLAALWFAVCEPGFEGKPGIVWAFSYRPEDVLSNTRDVESPFSIDRPLVYFPDHVFPFVRAQLAVFTIHNRSEGDPGKFSPLEEMKDANFHLTKIQIPHECFPSIRYHLFRVGVDPASMFPGLKGLVDRIHYENMLSEDERKIYWPPKPSAQEGG